MKLIRSFLAALALVAAAPASAQGWDAKPWLEDLAQMRAALQEKYANLDWLTEERGFPLDRGFAQVEAMLAKAGSDAEARALFERVVRRIGDGHVDLIWPKAAAPGGGGTAGPRAASCEALGYDGRQVRPGTAVAIEGYRALEGTAFPAGMIGDVGVVRIGVFDPHGYPALCRAALAASSLPADKPCDDACEDVVLTATYRAMTEGLATTLARLRAEGATALLVDISDNGGGSEWAEAAARMLTPRTLVSARMGFMRGEHWVKQWNGLASRLRDFAKSASKADRARLLGWAAEAEAAAKEAATPCDPATGCARLGRAGFATGLVGDAPAGAFAGKDWGVYVFSPAQYAYQPGAWDGPLVVLTDNETWSAAEEFAAMLRDNDAAVLLGARTGGAGCGHTWGGTPTTLKHSGAVLEVPDCVRFRKDGSNEVRGVIPDVVTGVRASDGAKFRAALTAAKLGEAVALAKARYRH